MRCPLYLFGKLNSRRTLTGSAAVPAHATATAMHFPANAGLIFLMDELTNDKYLVDTGATLSLFPCTSKNPPSGPLLKGADGQPIPSWGFVSKTVQFHGKLFTSNFLQAAVSGPILGIDFLRKFRVTVSPESSQVQFACNVAAPAAPLISLPSSHHPVPSACRPDDSSSSPHPVVPEIFSQVKSSLFDARVKKSILDPKPQAMQPIPDSFPQDVKQLLQKFPSILRAGTVTPNPTHGVEHHIHTGSHPPVFAKARRLDPQKLAIAKAEFKALESAGIIRRSKSPWASPLHMVPKKDGSWRPCGDYRRLNLVTTPDKYPLPNMQDLANGLHGCKIFSKIDLVKGYHQIPVAPADIPKTAIITPFGLFEYLFTPFGLSNAAQTFQRMMDRTVDGLEGVFPYMDDSRVGSPDRETHLQHLSDFFAALAANGLAINLEKCVFAVPNLEFLGHKISAAGSSPLADQVDAIKSCPPPQDVKQLQSFLGTVNFYRRFLPKCAQVLRPLTDLLRGNPKTLVWTAAAQRAL